MATLDDYVRQLDEASGPKRRKRPPLRIEGSGKAKVGAKAKASTRKALPKQGGYVRAKPERNPPGERAAGAKATRRTAARTKREGGPRLPGSLVDKELFGDAGQRAFEQLPRRDQIKHLKSGGAFNPKAGKAPTITAKGAVKTAATLNPANPDTQMRIARTLLHTVGATGEAVARDPIKQAKLAGKQAHDIAKGVIALIEAPVLIGDEALRGGGNSPTAAKLTKSIKDDLKHRYGPAFRGDKGAFRTQADRQRKEGSLYEVLDVATAGIPANAAATATARTAARLAKPGSTTKRVADKAVRATTTRRPLRLSPATTPDAVKPQRVRRTLTGAAAAGTRDKVRDVAQKRAVSRAQAGKAKLSPRRAAVLPGEVAHLSEVAAKRAAAKRVAKTERKKNQQAATIIDREVRGRKGSKNHPERGTVRANMREFTPAEKVAIFYGVEGGIKDSVSGAAYMRDRAAQLEAERAARPLTDAEKVRQDELPDLRALAADARVFDDPAIRTAIEQEIARGGRISTPDRGFTPARAELARRQPQAATIDIERIVEETVPEYTARIADELGVHPVPHETPARYRARLARALDVARAGGTNTPAHVYRRPGETVKAYTARLARELDIHPAKGEKPAAYRARLLEAVRTQRVEPPAPRRKGESDAEFIARIDEAAAARGLSQPGYLPSRYDSPDEAQLRAGLGGPTPGAAGAPLKARGGEVFRRGLERKDPELLVESHSRTIRGGENMRATAEILEREGRMFVDEAQAREWLALNRVDEDAVDLVGGPGSGLIVRKGMAPPAQGLKEGGPGDLGDFVQTDAVYVVPKSVTNEVKAQRGERGKLERAANRTMSVQSAALLGLSPSWAMFQVLADGMALTAAGGLHNLIRETRAYREMDDVSRDITDVAIGGNPANDVLLRLDPNQQLGRIAAAMDASPTYQRFFENRNPLTALLRVQAKQAASFRRAALLSKLEKDARTAAIDAGLQGARGPMQLIQRALSKPDPAEQARLLADPKAVEAAAAHVDSIMGNFADYTAAERKSLRNILPFYGFLRHSLRALFVTLPLDHPYMGILIGQVGRLGVEEARDIVGDDLPYGLSAFYNHDGTKAVDFARASPTLNAITSINKPAQAAGLFPPLVSIIGNQIAGKNLFLDRPYKVERSATPTSDLTETNRTRIALRELLNVLAPFRIVDKVQAEPQSDDSLPFSRRPLRALSPGTAIDLEESTERRRGQSTTSQVLHELFPLLTPVQPTENKAKGKRATLKRKQREAAAETRRQKIRDLEEDPFAQMKFDAAVEKERFRRLLAPDGADEDAKFFQP